MGGRTGGADATGRREGTALSHMVIFHTRDGQTGYEEVDELHDAVQLVESLRNRRGVEQARIFEMEEVPFDFRPYFRVELGDEPAPAPDPGEVIRVEDLTWSEHAASQAPQAVPQPAPQAPQAVPQAPQAVPQPAPQPAPQAPQAVPQAPQAPQPVPQPAPQAPQPYGDLPFADNGEQVTPLTESAQIPEPPPPPPPPPPVASERVADDGETVLGSRRGLFGL